MNQKILLQCAVAIAGLVPVIAGAAGAFWPESLGFVGTALPHAAYLSGLLLGIGLGFWSTIPAIQSHRARFTLLTFIVVLGGLARLAIAIRLNAWGPGVTLPLVMELAVTPALWAWQGRIARRAR